MWVHIFNGGLKENFVVPSLSLDFMRQFRKYMKPTTQIGVDVHDNTIKMFPFIIKGIRRMDLCQQVNK